MTLFWLGCFTGAAMVIGVMWLAEHDKAARETAIAADMFVRRLPVA